MCEPLERNLSSSLSRTLYLFKLQPQIINCSRRLIAFDLSENNGRSGAVGDVVYGQGSTGILRVHQREEQHHRSRLQSSLRRQRESQHVGSACADERVRARVGRYPGDQVVRTARSHLHQQLRARSVVVLAVLWQRERLHAPVSRHELVHGAGGSVRLQNEELVHRSGYQSQGCSHPDGHLRQHDGYTAGDRQTCHQQHPRHSRQQRLRQHHHVLQRDQRGKSRAERINSVRESMSVQVNRILEEH